MSPTTGAAARMSSGLLAALDALVGWLRSTSWAVELAAASARPRTRELLARMGGFLDAFAGSDVAYFERHLRADASLIFPGMSEPVDKQGCLGSLVASHPPYRRHDILGEPVVRLVGAATTVITVTAEVATAADEAARWTFITAVIEETDPWQLVHLQWTPADPTHAGKETQWLTDAPPRPEWSPTHAATTSTRRGPSTPTCSASR